MRKGLCSAQVLLLVEPQVVDLALAQQLVDETWSGAVAVLLNAAFCRAGQSLSATENASFVSSIDTVYAFQPVAVTGLLGSMQGAVVRGKPPPQRHDSALQPIWLSRPFYHFSDPWFLFHKD